jgi:hypothetical protein
VSKINSEPGKQTLKTIRHRMRLRATTQSRVTSFHWPALAFVAGALVILAGCATKPDNPNAPLPREDLAEYRRVTVTALRVVKTALQSLDRTVARTPCPPRDFKAFTREVQRLEVDSFEIRARAQAIRTRGSAYFEQWQEHLANLKDPAARQLAEQRRDRLQERFARIRLITQESREAFQPFMAGLRRLRNGLENNPAIAGTDSMKELIRTTRDNGQKVEAGLTAILGELDGVAAILKPDKTAKKD